MPKPYAIQDGNPKPMRALKTLKSSELPDSYIGITAHLPRSKDLEVIFEPEHLVDGDYGTSWSARAHKTSVPGSVDWVQVDLGSEHSLKEIRLVPYWKTEGFPVDFVVKLREGHKWQTVHEACGVVADPSWGEGKKEAYKIPVPSSTKADAMRIEVTRYYPVSGFFTDCGTTYFFRLSELEAINIDGQNVALASKGAKVTASSTFHSYFNSAKVVNETYKEIYDLGVKWNRVGQWGDWTCWAAVEQKKGEYHMDPLTDKAIRDSVKNGVNILYTLYAGNSLYEETKWLSDPGPVWRHGHPFTGDGGPTKPETIQAFVNYAKFVAKHFKGVVKYYEVWNEENGWAWYGMPPDPRAYGTLVRETAKALKEIDPEIKVLVGGTAALAPTFISQSLELGGGGKYVDGIGFHPYTMPYAEMGLGSLDVIDGKQQGKSKEELGFTTYEEMLEFLRKTFAPFNSNLEFWANEWNVISSREDVVYSGGISEVSECKHAARFYLMSTLTRTTGIWWMLVSENYIWDLGLLRAGDLSKKPLFYTFQALTTVLSGARPDKTIGVTITGEAPGLRCETLRGRDGEALIAIWSVIHPADDRYEGKRVSVKVDVSNPKQVDAVDTVYSVVQTINFKDAGGSIVMDGMRVTDYPIIIRIR